MAAFYHFPLGGLVEKKAYRMGWSDSLRLPGEVVIVGNVFIGGTGNPAGFFTMLRENHMNVDEFSRPDHFDYTTNPFEQIDADLILITEKDVVKCARIDMTARDMRIWIVPVKAQFDDGLAQQIVEKRHIALNSLSNEM